MSRLLTSDLRNLALQYAAAFLFAIALICTSFFSQVSHSENLKPLKQLVTYEEFEDLVKHSISRMPELAELWEFQRANETQVHFGGGVLRGLLHWLYLQLQTQNIEEVKLLNIPVIDWLQLQKGSDIDLFIPDDMERKLLYTSYAEWDKLKDSVHFENIKLGGPTVEKIKANLDGIVDPARGLRHYYEGRLHFAWTPEAEFRELYWVKLRGNSRTTEALRFIRFANNLPELKPDSESIENIKNIHIVEASLIKSSTHYDFFLHKGLEKLHTSTNENFERTLHLLKKYNLLTTVGIKRLALKKSYSLAEKVDHLLSDFFDIKDLKAAANLMTSNIDDKANFVLKTLPLTTTPKEFLIIADNFKENGNATDDTKIETAITTNLEHFKTLNPTLDEIIKLKILSKSSQAIQKSLNELGIKKVRTTSDFLNLFHKHYNTAQNLKEPTSKLIEENLQKFFNLNPTQKETRILHNNPNNTQKLKRKIREQAKQHFQIKTLFPITKTIKETLQDTISACRSLLRIK